MARVSVLKGLGYLVSTVSVVLLAIVSWKSASKDPWLAACLLLGAATSVSGMGLRWISHREEQREKKEDPRQASPKQMSWPSGVTHR